MTQKFARFCNVCYELFSDPVLYQEHADVCGKVQATATEAEARWGQNRYTCPTTSSPRQPGNSSAFGARGLAAQHGK